MKNLRYLTKFILVCFLLILTNEMVTASTSFGPPIDEEGAYTISRSLIGREIELGEIFSDVLKITNNRDSQLSVSISLTQNLEDLVEIDVAGLVISGKNNSEAIITIIGKKIGIFEGKLILSGDINTEIPVNISISEKNISKGFKIDIRLEKKRIKPTDDITFVLKLDKHSRAILEDIKLSYFLKNTTEDEKIILHNENINLTNSIQEKRTFKIPNNLTEGFYILGVDAEHEGDNTSSMSEIQIAVPFLFKKLGGFIPVWSIFIGIAIIVFSIGSYVYIKKAIEKRKKYKMTLDLKTLPKKGERTLYLGKIAEKNMNTYLEIDRLTTHAVVAGATGGGKSISAQVIVEEALKKDIAVIVFDPTAQWSGMLRKCEDKKMLSFYPKFGLKPSDAKAFPGNVKMIKDPRQAIDIKKYMNPGHIQILALNKLDPSDMDKFVSSVIVSIFRSSPEEHPGLRFLLVFDEVHRLLPKFGGSGEGFLQIERACREFRKWGFGVMLVSQVLSDFVGEIKANINTEVQMRTRDESDLERIKTKYGESFLQSLIKASVGTGMCVNPAHNKGSPYFVAFRPILHSTRRLPDDVLDKYNEYGEKIEDLEYQIEQLETEKVDTFDLKMELKLVKDKLMTGNFSVVDIYLEGLLPRFEKQWQTIGKKPKKKELELIEEKELKQSLSKAAEERKKWEKEQGVKEKTEIKVAPENKSTKIVKPLTFDNGMSVSSLKELKEVLPNLEEDVLKSHLNDNKNDIADWAGKEIDEALGNILKKAKNKESILNEIGRFEKPGQDKDKKSEGKEQEDKKQNIKKDGMEKKDTSIIKTKPKNKQDKNQIAKINKKK